MTIFQDWGNEAGWRVAFLRNAEIMVFSPVRGTKMREEEGPTVRGSLCVVFKRHGKEGSFDR